MINIDLIVYRCVNIEKVLYFVVPMYNLPSHYYIMLNDCHPFIIYDITNS